LELTEQQLETWSHPGARTTAKSTADAIKNSLTGSWRLAGKNVEVYLQGSYKNDTNIRGDSDVDIVVQLNSTFMPDLSELPAILQPWSAWATTRQRTNGRISDAM
jgi:tRNA nucleotidyltransferase (CCA-adding enzyme)